MSVCGDRTPRTQPSLGTRASGTSPQTPTPCLSRARVPTSCGAANEGQPPWRPVTAVSSGMLVVCFVGVSPRGGGGSGFQPAPHPLLSGGPENEVQEGWIRSPTSCYPKHLKSVTRGVFGSPGGRLGSPWVVDGWISEDNVPRRKSENVESHSMSQMLKTQQTL